jgi:CheY-like chemotaxis protein
MPKILIVEDNEENREALSRRLERRGYSIIIAVDGRAGVTMAQEEKPDLILMDLNLPGVDGWEATRMIKANVQTASIPVIALTAHAVAGDQQRALQAGCNDYHSKPVEFPRLLGQIEALLGAPQGETEAEALLEGNKGRGGISEG